MQNSLQTAARWEVALIKWVAVLAFLGGLLMGITFAHLGDMRELSRCEHLRISNYNN